MNMNSLRPQSSRRSFLQAASSAPVVALASGGLTAQARTRSDGTLRRSDFEPCLGDVFVFESESGGTRAQARLQQVRALPESQHAELSFTLLFTPEPGVALPEGTWRFSTAQGPSGLIFVSPNDAQGREIEAVFNRG